MFIDVHSHIYQELYTCGPLPEYIAKLEGFPIHEVDNLPENVNQLEGINLDKFLKEIDKINIKYIVSLAQDNTRSLNSWVGSNALAADLQLKSKGRIIGMAGANPLDKYDRLNTSSLYSLEFYIKKRKLKGLIFTPPYEHYFINDRRTYPFYAKAVELDIPLYVHQAAQYQPPADFTPLEYGCVWLLDQVAIDFPKLRINVEHMAFPWTQELLAIMAHAPNVYTDIAELIRRPTILAWNIVMAKEYKVIDRVMYGSDHVGNDVSDYINRVKKEIEWCKTELNKIIKRAGWPTLSEDEINGILTENAIKFLKLNKNK